MNNLFNRIFGFIVARFPRLARVVLVAVEHARLGRQPVDTGLGFKFSGNQAMQRGLFEVEETELVKKAMEQVDVLINVGANIGYYCCIALAMNKRVVAFEPIAMNVQYLLKNVEANGWKNNIEVFPLALSNGIGIVKIYGGGTGASLIKGWAGASEEDFAFAPTSTADLVLGNRFHGKKCLVLVDIEGAEKYFLEGADTLLRSEIKPMWMVEISISTHQPKGIKVNPNLYETFKMFWDRGYDSWAISKPFRKVHPEEVEKIASGGEDTIGTYNFLFVEKGTPCDLLER